MNKKEEYFESVNGIYGFVSKGIVVHVMEVAMFVLNKRRKKLVAFAAMLVWISGLLACSSGEGKTVLQGNAPLPENQEISEREKVIISTKPTETLEIKEDTKPLEKESGFVDEKHKISEGFDNMPTKEAGEQKGFEILDDGLNSTGEDEEQEPQKVGQSEETEPQETEHLQKEFQTWQSAYLDVIYHLWDYLAPRYEPCSFEETRRKFDDPMDLYIFYLGLHDFDGDGILELITGDGSGMAVFTYKDGIVEKIADLCEPDLSATWCVNGVCFKDNSIRVDCAGSGERIW